MDIESLFKSAQSGNKDDEIKLFKHLVLRFRYLARHKIWNRDDSEEVIQDALIVVVQKYKELKIEKSFSGWAHQVITFQILKYYKKKAFRLDKMLELTGENHPFIEWKPDTEFRRKLLICLKELNRLNNRYARLLNLHYQGYKPSEVAEKLEITENHHYVVLHKARNLLDQCLKTGRIKG